MALSAIPISPAFTVFEGRITEEFRNMLVAFYGDDYINVLAKGKLLGDEKIMKVYNTVRKAEQQLGITIIKEKKIESN